jgi:endo-1,3(4)-beta-glucanase
MPQSSMAHRYIGTCIRRNQQPLAINHTRSRLFATSSQWGTFKIGKLVLGCKVARILCYTILTVSCRFWGAQKSEISAIQILPVTPANEYLYDSAWVKNVYDYTQAELTDPSIGDEWKCVIYDAYSQYDPQTAASRSTQLSSWGSGNTYTNTLYFISTRPNTGGPICASTDANPVGTFTIQSDTGLYVTSSAANVNLVASTTNVSAATPFKFAWLPNAGTIQSTVTKQYVTADQTGINALAAARTAASTWEGFRIRQKVGAAVGVYSIKANSNGLYVIVGAGGTLINNATTEATSSGFTLH